MSLRQHRSRVSHDRWLVSYADFITLLFAFFVVLFAASKADQKKQMLVSQSIDSAFRSFAIAHDPTLTSEAGNSVFIGASIARAPAVRPGSLMDERLVSPEDVQKDLNQIHQQLEQMLSDQIARHFVSIRMDREGLVISLHEMGFFNSGSAVPKPEAFVVLRQIGDSLGRTAYNIRVEGHTDNVPIHTDEFDSNWDLSSARATRIARVFLESRTIAPDRLSTAGYAEFHPEASNETAEGRSKNRRVDLVVFPQSSIDFSAPPISNPSGVWRKITDAD